jgi:predicted HTH domain antitoxin
MAPPSFLERDEELCALALATGLYESREAFLSDTVHTLLAAKPDLREAIAGKLYEERKVSLGRAAVWAGLTIESMKAALARRDVLRQAPQSPAETEATARRTLESARSFLTSVVVSPGFTLLPSRRRRRHTQNLKPSFYRPIIRLLDNLSVTELS